MLSLATRFRAWQRMPHLCLTLANDFDASELLLDSRDNEVVGAYTPVTKTLWLSHKRWSPEQLAQTQPLDGNVTPRPPSTTSVTYPFSTDPVLHRNPWQQVRIGRILEDLDSLAGYIAYKHSEPADSSLRPPLLVTATVEAIELLGHRMVLDRDLTLSGSVVWTGTSSMDICIEVKQGGAKQMVALLTFVARDPLTGKSQRVNPVRPETEQGRQLFAQRQEVADVRRAARKAARGEQLHHVRNNEQEAFAVDLLHEAATKQRLPALADGNSLLMEQTVLANTFTCQPQQRNLHGVIFGGFLMRRAFEIAHSAAYMFAGTRPRTLGVDEIAFKRPVEVGDLITFTAVVLHSWQSAQDSTHVSMGSEPQGLMHVQVEASVTNPEQRSSAVSNTFNFEFTYQLPLDASGFPIPPKRVLPTTEQAAAEVARFYGPGAEQDVGNLFLKLV